MAIIYEIFGVKLKYYLRCSQNEKWGRTFYLQICLLNRLLWIYVRKYLQRTSVKIVSFFFEDVSSFFSQVTHVLETLNADILVIIVFEIPKLAFLSTILGNFADWAGFQFLIFLHQLLSVKFAIEAKPLIFEAHFSSLNYRWSLKIFFPAETNIKFWLV